MMIYMLILIKLQRGNQRAQDAGQVVPAGHEVAVGVLGLLPRGRPVLPPHASHQPLLRLARGPHGRCGRRPPSHLEASRGEREPTEGRNHRDGAGIVRQKPCRSSPHGDHDPRAGRAGLEGRDETCHGEVSEMG